MSQQKEFKPVITRVELSPEQAVLQCSCYTSGRVWNKVKLPGTDAYACSDYNVKQLTSGWVPYDVGVSGSS